MKRLPSCFLTIAFILSCNPNKVTEIDLSGVWGFRMDTADLGEREAWFNETFNDKILLPGSMAENGKRHDITLQTKWTGDIKNPDWCKDTNYAPYHDPDNIRFPYWLQPNNKYTGAAWYQKEIIIPAYWKKKTIFLNLERCHWETTVWLNKKMIGTQNSLATPHTYELTGIMPGRNVITIRVDNRIKEIDPGWNSHSITDHTQTNGNGMIGKLSLQSEPSIYIKGLILFSDIDKKSVDVKAHVYNELENARNVTVHTYVEALNNENGNGFKKITQGFKVSPGKNVLTIHYELGENPMMWDEFNPHLYNLHLNVCYDDKGMDYHEVFGLREINVKDGQIKMNGRKLFLRGTLECAIFPKTGYPPTNVEEWRRIYKVIKSHGLNHMRFHSWCPPEAAFIAADEEGLYLQVECPSWANQTTTLGDGKPIDRFIWEENKRIIETYGNHPSFCFMAYGNEPGGGNYKMFLAHFVNYWKENDNRRLYTIAAGWPAITENDYHNIPAPRIQGWGKGLNSIINAEPPTTNYDWYTRGKMPDDGVPVISHEIGQWCVYPNFKEMEKYTGALKPKNFELFQECLRANHMGHRVDSFVLASGKLQALCYKADIEAALRTKGMGGFQLLDLHDFPGQGTALVGILDPFWEQKGYIDPEEFKQFCNELVPLVRLKKRIFIESEQMEANIEVAYYTNARISSAQAEWFIKNSQGEVIENGITHKTTIPVGNGTEIGTIHYSFPALKIPTKYYLEVNIGKYMNQWDIWLYPDNKNILEKMDVLVTDKLDTNTIQALDNGQTVLLSMGKGKVKEEKGGEVEAGFSGIFWNTAWTNEQKPHTLGILCDPNHPASSLFPTEYHSNWQWWDAMTDADVIKLNDFPVDLKPIVRVIDDWFTNRRLALLIEARVNNGKLLISGTDLHSNLENRPGARQMLASLNRYMSSERFNPVVALTVSQIQGIMK